MQRNFDIALNLTRQIIWGLNFNGGRARVAVVTFGDEAQIKFTLNTYSRQIDVLNAVAFTQDLGRTNTYSGLKEVRENIFRPRQDTGDRPGVDNVVLVLTDGRSNINSEDTVPEARRLHSEGIKVFGIGIGENGQVDRNEINGIASDQTDVYARVIQYPDEIEETANHILEQLCT